MPTKRYKPEQIMTVLRRVEVVIANGKLTPQACREAGISEQTFYPEFPFCLSNFNSFQ